VVDARAEPDYHASSIENWLTLQSDVDRLSREQAIQALLEIGRPQDLDQIFHYGLLNQRLGTFGGWTQARDTLQGLAMEPDLTQAQLQLINLLREFNQALINCHVRHQELGKENERLRTAVAEARETSVDLEQKIQALTELEADMSTRRGD